MSAYIASLSQNNGGYQVRWCDQGNGNKFVDVSYPADFVCEGWPPHLGQSFAAIPELSGAKTGETEETKAESSNTATQQTPVAAEEPAPEPIALPGREPIAPKTEKVLGKK